MEQCDIAIVGAGMVGSTLALALKDSGLTILLVDSSPLRIRHLKQNNPSSHASVPYLLPVSVF